MLLSYSLLSYAKAFNKSWAQSPYLFPLLVAVALIGLSIWVMGEGVTEMKRRAAESSGAAGRGETARPAGAARSSGTVQAGSGETAQTAGGAVQETQAAGAAQAAGKSGEKLRWVVTALIICGLYYLALGSLHLPQVTIGILSFRYMFSTFEIVTVVFLIAMMAFMGVRKPAVLALVPLGTTLFLSIAFRTLLHVLLP